MAIGRQQQQQHLLLPRLLLLFFIDSIFQSVTVTGQKMFVDLFVVCQLMSGGRLIDAVILLLQHTHRDHVNGKQTSCMLIVWHAHTGTRFCFWHPFCANSLRFAFSLSSHHVSVSGKENCRWLTLSWIQRRILILIALSRYDSRCQEKCAQPFKHSHHHLVYRRREPSAVQLFFVFSFFFSTNALRCHHSAWIVVFCVAFKFIVI